jgi:hypothetical protein
MMRPSLASEKSCWDSPIYLEPESEEGAKTQENGQVTTIEMTPDVESLCQTGEAAWARLKTTSKDWDDWIAVGETLEAGRNWAKADSKSPTANGYPARSRRLSTICR